MREMNKVLPLSRNKWFGYRHVNGTDHIKSWFTKDEYDEIASSPSVVWIYGPYYNDSRDDAIDTFKDEFKNR